MSEHTPGPWFIGETLEGKSLAVIGDRDSVVCEFPDRLGFSVDADAQLIASAPELLRVLRRELAQLDGTACYRSMSARADDLRAAIAKATGEGK